jgi:diketogulonate reductase-like aldo/keto reductase
MSFRAPAVSSAKALIPEILYGTAWKKDKTQGYVEEAIRAGFRAIDTACQPKHYYEKGVGDAVTKLVADGIVRREDLFIQTKYSPAGGQDMKTIPYDPNAPIRDQVFQSVSISLANLQTSYIDSLIMHSPMRTMAETLAAWKAFEEVHHQGLVRFLGMSNTYDLRVLRAVYDAAEIKPSFLQNRFYSESGFDVEIREFCRNHDIKYQSFWTLTANPNSLRR